MKHALAVILATALATATSLPVNAHSGGCQKNPPPVSPAVWTTAKAVYIASSTLTATER